MECGCYFISDSYGTPVLELALFINKSQNFSLVRSTNTIDGYHIHQCCMYGGGTLSAAASLEIILCWRCSTAFNRFKS